MSGEHPPRPEHPAATLRRIQGAAKRRFGQNFLVDSRAVERIAEAAGAEPGRRVVEIGPGLGALSRVLLARGAQVRAVELDPEMVAHLAQELPALEVVRADAAQVDWAELAPGQGWVACGNLPYNAATAILDGLLRSWPRFERLIFMFQREVADRVVAPPGGGDRGALSVLCQAWAEPTRVLALPPGAFHPAPKVHSAVVRFTLRPQPLLGGCSPEDFERAVRAGFSQRRKLLSNALRTAYTREVALEALGSLGLGARRAEELDLDTWGALAGALALGQRSR